MAVIFFLLAGLVLAETNSPWVGPSANTFSEAGSGSGSGSGVGSAVDSVDTQYDPDLLRLIESSKGLKMVPDCLSCKLAGEAGKGLLAETLTFEDQKTCGKDRNYFSDGIAKVPEDFRKARASFPEAQIPKSCVLYAMKFGAEFAKCSGPTGQPVLSGKKPCVTEAYVNVVYNSYVDVMDCFGMSQKYFMPKLFNESGFHINAFGEGGYMGIGQLGGSALRDVNEAFSDYIKIITEGTKPSCKRLSKQSGWLKQVSSTTGRCQMLAPPQSPVVNLIYTAMLHLQNKKSIDERYEKEEIREKLNKMGLIDFDEGRLKEIMYTLSYNTGPGTAMSYLKNYLKVRKEQKGNLVLADFDFSLEGGGGKKQSFRLTFPRYLAIHQTVGGRGYNSLLVKKKKELDQALGQGVCTQEPYLAL